LSAEQARAILENNAGRVVERKWEASLEKWRGC
jgi:hypothetical protein